MKPVSIVRVEESDVKRDGYYMDRETAKNLADNIDSLKAYVEKLELLVGKMAEYYGDKTEEYKKLESP